MIFDENDFILNEDDGYEIPDYYYEDEYDDDDDYEYEVDEYYYDDDVF